MDDVSWRDYVDTRFAAQQEAVRIATNALEKRLDSVNEFRGQLKDQVATFTPRTESDQRFKTLEDKISAKSFQLFISYGVALASMGVAIYNFARING